MLTYADVCIRCSREGHLVLLFSQLGVVTSALFREQLAALLLSLLADARAVAALRQYL
jgi:hypothetical protein